jgi:hypothetical protein
MAINVAKAVLRRLDQVNHTVENAWLFGVLATAACFRACRFA